MPTSPISIVAILENTASQHGSRTAIVADRRYTYAEVENASNRIANTLISMNIKKGDRVAMLLGNTPEFICTYFGIIKSGAIAVPLDTRYKVNELASVCGDCRPRVIIAESPALDALAPSLAEFDYVEKVIATNPAFERKFLTYQDIMSSAPPNAPRIKLTLDDEAAISYSGGPAVHPKGVVLTQRSLVTEAVNSGEAFQQTADDVVMLFALPLYHMYGLDAVLLTSVNQGSTIVIVPGTGVSIVTLMETIEKEKGTIIHAVPYIYALAVQVAKREGIKHDLSTLRHCFSGGAPLPVSTIHQFKQTYGLTLEDIYGMTEAVCQVSCPPPGTAPRIGAAGKALRGFEIRIVDDNDKVLPAGRDGEIIVKGHIMKGYYNNPQATAMAIRNGWLHTGDIGKLDKDGYLYITGRKKRMIILKGQNVYPAEIEEVLSMHPAVTQCRVTGVTDRLRGEIVRAYICLKPGEKATEADIRRFCQERMADYRIPREFIFTDAIPEIAPARFPVENAEEVQSNLPPLPYSTSSDNKTGGC